MQISGTSVRFAVAFAMWCAIVALRAVYTRPPEVLWFVGITAGFLCAAACGYIWRGWKPARDRRRRRRALRRAE